MHKVDEAVSVSDLKKLTNSSVKWPGLKGLDLALTVTTKKKYRRSINYSK